MLTLQSVIPWIVLAIFLFWILSRVQLHSTPPMNANWLTEANACTTGLFTLAVPTGDDSESASARREYIAYPPASTLLDQSASLISRAQAFQADLTPIEDLALATLIRERRKALKDVNRDLLNVAPQLRARLKAFPIDATATIYAAITLVGFLYLWGYYSPLGIPVVPFLRKIDEIFLVGVTGGIFPIAISGLLLALAFSRILHLRKVAENDSSSVAQLREALCEMDQVRTTQFWLWPLIVGLVATVNIAVVLGAEPGLHASFDQIEMGEQKIPKSTLLGSLGSFAILLTQETGSSQATSADASDRGAIAVVPLNKLDCLARFAGDEELESRDSLCEKTLDAKGDSVSLQLTHIINDLVARPPRATDTWRGLIEREGQCHVADAVKPLISPVFVDNSPTKLDTNYYRSNGGPMNCQKAALEDCFKDQLLEFGKALPDDLTYHSINVVGFGSGTGTPARNAQLADERANYVARLISLYPRLNGCRIDTDLDGQPRRAGDACPVDIRWWGVGKLRNIPGSDFYGDAVERRVVIALCDQDFKAH